MKKTGCKVLFCVMVICLSSGKAAAASSSAGEYAPPATEEALTASVYPIAPSAVDGYLSQVSARHAFRDLEGRNDALKAAASDSVPLKVADGYAVDLPADVLFSAPVANGECRVFLAEVSSVDALSLRLRVDLSGLKPGEEAWVLDPTVSRAFGPYYATDDVPGGRWLATTSGDTAALMVRTPSASLPSIAVKGISHFYTDFKELKELACNINIVCDADPMVQQIAAGVAMLLIPNGNQTFAGSGVLINVPDTEELEPYFLTAYHLIADRDTARNTDIVWDYRSTACATNNAKHPSLLPHSRGADLLATSATLDATLIELDSVPDGPYGRTYLGWDTRSPKLDEAVIVIHHPAAKQMRISYGRVQAIDLTVSTFLHETRVGWYDGVTEPGSSGGCLLYADGTYRIAGTLTGGSTQTCTEDPQKNFDYFSSFPAFFREISPAYLKGTSGFPSYERPGTGEGEGEGEGECEGPQCPGLALAANGPPSGPSGDALTFCVTALVLIYVGTKSAASRRRESCKA